MVVYRSACHRWLHHDPLARKDVIESGAMAANARQPLRGAHTYVWEAAVFPEVKIGRTGSDQEEKKCSRIYRRSHSAGSFGEDRRCGKTCSDREQHAAVGFHNHHGKGDDRTA